MRAERQGRARILTRLALAAALFLADQVVAQAASYLSRCPIIGAAPAGSVHQVLAVDATPPSVGGCVVRPLPIDALSVIAVVPAPRRPAGAPEPQTVTLAGMAAPTGFEIRDVVVGPRSATPLPPYLVPDADLRWAVSASAFGGVGRTMLTSDADALTLDCAPGEEPAGFAFATARVPPIPGMTLRVVHTADRPFRVIAARPGAPRSRAPQLLVLLKETESVTESHAPLPADLPTDTPLDLEVRCPPDGGRLVLSEIALEAQTTVPPDRAAWVRDAGVWQNKSARLFARAQRWGLSRLYIRVPAGDAGLVDAQALAGFVTDANARGIAVWALLSDRLGGGDTGRDALVREGAALADYNAGVPTEAQIKGVQVEVAPELLWAYVPDRVAEADVFLASLARARPVVGMSLDAALPAWFPTAPPIAERLAGIVDSVTVIDDRTDPSDVRRTMARFLAWGVRRGRPVQVALEAGPLPDSEERRFERAASGELWLVPLGGSEAVVLLKAAAAGLPGIALQQAEVTPVPASSRTFAGRKVELREVLAAIGRPLGAWPSFAGFAFHDLFWDRD